eukprot:5003110-Amphidinium_carterae.1
MAATFFAGGDTGSSRLLRANVTVTSATVTIVRKACVPQLDLPYSVLGWHAPCQCFKKLLAGIAVALRRWV